MHPIVCVCWSTVADPSPRCAVSLREFQGDDEGTAELFADEKEAAAAAKAQEEHERATQVPGLLKVRSVSRSRRSDSALTFLLFGPHAA